MTETRTSKQIAADKLDELIERLEKAEGPDRELDSRIWLETSPGVTRSVQHVVSATGAWPPYDIDETRDETGRLITVPSFTASLDAAVELAERVLPGCRWGVTQGDTPEDDFQGNVWPGVQPYQADFDVFGYHKSAPLALCLAILKAVRAHMHPRDREETNQ
ncbi:hypothetical protein SAMN05892877_117107 [Rhizobium subbaraonis]|uniref:Phage ABA sandwich domain-containing protein n=1 Tax=Rhizobium subbaraonis TaxID=908946 RepID=A0A285UWI5_9HYPH|nr:hypothetical protein [Rhizobium subbaraonis]SOC45718.1 hypothetical protein SAMN05892877_117107 [Rhizobium subbaraonis]